MAEVIKDELEDLFETVRGQTIAVVGNAVFQTAFGEEIDAHEVIIRFNNFKRAGYEEFVGSRITWWCCHPYIPNYEHHYDPSICHRHYKEHRVAGTVIRPKFDFWQEYRTKTHKALSSGITILLIFDRLGIDVDAYGFDHFESGHYWDEGYQRRDFHTYENETEVRDILTHVDWRGC